MSVKTSLNINDRVELTPQKSGPTYQTSWSLRIMKKAETIARTLTAKMGNTAAFTSRLARKPAILRHWLLSARWAQLVLVLVVLTMPSLIPSAVDRKLEKLYPPITTNKLFGLMKRTKPNPRLESRQKLVRVLLWTGSGGVVLYFLLVHIPRAISQATVLARKLENKADALVELQPSTSIILYNSALSLAFDIEYEATLSGKLKALDERLSEISEHENGVSAKPKSAAEMPQTVVLEAGSEQSSRLGEAKSTRTIRTIGTRNDGVGPEGRYHIQQELGRGAMGIVYRAHDRVLGRDVALKQLPAYLSHDQRLVERFQQEARALARLSHPHIVQVYDFVRDGDQAWIAMELVEGEELEKSLQKSGALSIGEAVRLGVQLAKALAYAHERGVIHRDFKPANVLLAQKGLSKIADFGLAKLAQSSIHTQEGAVLGSPAYMSPEQAAGKDTDARSDIYAFGVTLYKMLTGRVPFEGDVAGAIVQKLTKDPTPLTELNDHIPEQLKRLMSKMLEKEPDKRPASMHAVAEALKASSYDPVM